MRNRTDEERQALHIRYYRTDWLRRNNLTCKGIGERLGVSGTRITTIFREGLCPARYIAVLRDEFGMPEDLLPSPSREKSGPLSAAEREAQGQASPA